MLLGNAAKAGVQAAADQLVPLVRERAEIVLVDLNQNQDTAAAKADLAIVLGGDGAILRATRQMGYHQVPTLGVNLGKLGFLAEVSLAALMAQLPAVLNRQWTVSKHVMFEGEVRGRQPPRKFLGLNELIIGGEPSLHLIDLDLFIDGELVSTYRGDGLIIATPIGSTGHNLSAGGPLLRQDLQAFVITPLCAHTLTYRPLVDRADRRYEVGFGSGRAQPLLIIDGQERITLDSSDRVTMTAAPVQFQMVRLPGRGYYQSLRDKLRWGSPPNYGV
jgi:NAD+ kinase